MGDCTGQGCEILDGARSLDKNKKIFLLNFLNVMMHNSCD